MVVQRVLGRSGIPVSGMGVGCWAIGGPSWRGTRPDGWGTVDDAESVRALRRAVDLGVTLFDTADVYGAGHSERVVGQALAPIRDGVIIATKFGNLFDEDTRQIGGASAEPEYIRAACDASLRRLGTDRIDLYQFHLGDYDVARVPQVLDALEGLVRAGKIRFYGWSTDDPDRGALFARGEHCVADQFRLSVLDRNDRLVRLCIDENLAAINKGPLGQGLLTGKFTHETVLPPDDIRHRWDLATGRQAERLERLQRVREVMARGGRTLAQAAIGWIWAHSPQSIPIPGFKTVAQVEDNAGALRYGPLDAAQMGEIEGMLQA